MRLSRIERIAKSNEFTQIVFKQLGKASAIDVLIDALINIKDDNKKIGMLFDRLCDFPFLLSENEIKIIKVFFEEIVASDQAISNNCSGIVNNNLKNLSPNALRIVEEILISIGQIQKAFEVFEVTIKKIILLYQVGKINGRMKIDALWAQIYASRFNMTEFNDDIANPYFFRENRFLFEAMKKIFIKKNIPAPRVRKRSFSEYIYGKKILILGPAPINCDDNFLNFDTVIVINYRGKEDYSERLKNVKNIISYYNYEAEDIINSEIHDIFGKLSYVCFKKIRFDYQRKIVAQGKGREYQCLDGMQLFGQPYILQNILFDLLCYKPKSVKLSCFSLYATRQLYTEGYVNRNNNVDKRFRAFAKHNIINQFMYLSVLADAGYILVDSFLEKLLSAGVEEYIYQISKC